MYNELNFAYFEKSKKFLDFLIKFLTPANKGVNF